MGITIDIQLKKRIINSINALGFIGVLMLLSVVLEYLGRFVG